MISSAICRTLFIFLGSLTLLNFGIYSLMMEAESVSDTQCFNKNARRWCNSSNPIANTLLLYKIMKHILYFNETTTNTLLFNEAMTNTLLFNETTGNTLLVNETMTNAAFQ